MLINIEKYKLKTYSIDCICIQKGNDTLSSSFDIRVCLNYLDKNGIKELKNRVGGLIQDYSTIDTSIIPNAFNTRNYKIKKINNIEYEVADIFNRNNTRWILKQNLMQKLYLLELNRMESVSLEMLVAELELLNEEFENMIGQ